MPEKRPRPAFVCTVCSCHGFNGNLINERCCRIVNGRACAGTNRAALQETDWRMCSLCNAAGLHAGGVCKACEGCGWLFVR